MLACCSIIVQRHDLTGTPFFYSCRRSNDQPLKPDAAKQQHSFEIKSDAYQIYEAETDEQARQRLQQFIAK